MPPPNLEYLRINDFSAGIQENPGAKPQSDWRDSITGMYGPVGSASITNTYRCIALPGGGLGPLPKGTDFDLGDAAPGGVITLAGSGKYMISGMYIQGPISSDPEVWSFLDQAELFLAREWIKDASPDTRQYQLKRWQLDGGGTARNISPNLLGGDGDGNNQDFAASNPNLYAQTFFSPGRANKSAVNEPGSGHLAVSYYDRGSGTLGFWAVYPDPDTPTALSWESLGSFGGGYHLSWAHQGRWCSAARDSSAFGTAAAGSGTEWYLNENVFFTKVNTTALQASTATVFAQDDARGFGYVESVSASDLLIVRNHGGALLIRGSLVIPQVETLRNVIPSRGYKGVGARTPIGYAYASKGQGVMIWSGGDESTPISPMLPGNFLEIEGLNSESSAWSYFDPYMGTMASVGDWLLCPNNWLFNIRTGAWWRMEDPTVFEAFHWQAGNSRPYLMAAPISHTSATTGPVKYFNLEGTFADTYRWQSNAISVGYNREAQVREILMVAQGGGDVTITVTNEAGTSVSKVFTVASNARPVRLRADIPQLQAQNIVVQIYSDSDASDAAPFVYEVALGIRDLNQLAKS